MAKSSTSFKKGNAASAKRGPNFHTKLINMIREESMIGASPDLNKQEAEKLFIKHMALRAFDSKDPNSGMLLKDLFNKSYANLKPLMPVVEFDLDEESKPAQQARQVLKAAADGIISPDVSQLFISNIASMIKIEEITEIGDRLKEVEAALGVNNA